MKVEEPFDPATITCEQLEERIRDVQDEVYQIKKLSEHPGWAMFASACGGNAKVVRAHRTGKALINADDSLSHNYHCGLADGLDRAITLRQELVEEIEQNLAELRKLLEEKEDARRSDADDTSSDDADPEPELPIEHAP